jgi:hypothetical protein
VLMLLWFSGDDVSSLVDVLTRLRRDAGDF